MQSPIAPALHSLFAQGWCQLFPSTAALHWNHKAHRMTRGVGPHFFFKEVVVQGLPEAEWFSVNLLEKKVGFF